MKKIIYIASIIVIGCNTRLVAEHKETCAQLDRIEQKIDDVKSMCQAMMDETKEHKKMCKAMMEQMEPMKEKMKQKHKKMMGEGMKIQEPNKAIAHEKHHSETANE